MAVVRLYNDIKMGAQKCPSQSTETISKNSGKKEEVINIRKVAWRWAANSTRWANLKFKRFKTFKLKLKFLHIE